MQITIRWTDITRLYRMPYQAMHNTSPDDKKNHSHAEKCRGCPYPGHGFVCWGKDDDCIRTRMERINEKKEE